MDSKAVIYVPHTADPIAGSVCLRWCEEQAHQVVSLAHRWRDVVALLCADLAQVAVVATRGDLPPTRRPRVEIVDEEIIHRSPQRRPRVSPPRADR